MWTKSGDLTRTIDPIGLVNRRCNYSNNSDNAIIRELRIGGYLTGDYRINVEAPSIEAYNRLKQAIITAGFPAPSSDDECSKRVSVVTADRNRLCQFLNAVKQEETSFNLIEDEIATSLGLTNLHQAAPLSIWEQLGLFTNTNPLVADGYRTVRYTTDVRDSLITEFELDGYSDNTYKFRLTLSNHSQELKSILNDRGFYYYELESMVLLQFSGNERARLNELLAILSEHSAHFAEIKEHFQQHITPVIVAASTVVSTMSIFQNVNTSSSPADNHQNVNACTIS